MHKWQGKPIIAWSIVLGLWAAIRVLPDPGAALNVPKSPVNAPVRVSNTIAFIPSASARQAIAPKISKKPEVARVLITAIFKTHHSLHSPATRGVPAKVIEHDNISLSSLSTMQDAQSLFEPVFTAQTDAAYTNPMPPAQPLLYLTKPNNSKRLGIYAYSFIRPNASVSSSLETAAPQYGGGQSGVIAAYRLAGGMRQNVSLLGRASLAHGAQEAAEFAAGMRIKPVNNAPLTVTVERRFRKGQQDVTALYAAGSVEDIRLPAQFMARGYAQMGIIPGRQNNQFYDVGIRMDRAVIKTTMGHINIGLGSWAGGQRGGGRLDIGPALRTDIKINSTARLNITADWRFRIAGGTKPDNGPAITISTGF
jgi:hypothetical protein